MTEKFASVVTKIIADEKIEMIADESETFGTGPSMAMMPNFKLTANKMLKKRADHCAVSLGELVVVTGGREDVGEMVASCLGSVEALSPFGKEKPKEWPSLLGIFGVRRVGRNGCSA